MSVRGGRDPLLAPLAEKKEVGGSGAKGEGGESFSLSCLPIIFGMTRAEESEEMRR